jgi:hypothetical protein
VIPTGVVSPSSTVLRNVVRVMWRGAQFIGVVTLRSRCIALGATGPLDVAKGVRTGAAPHSHPGSIERWSNRLGCGRALAPVRSGPPPPRAASPESGGEGLLRGPCWFAWSRAVVGGTPGTSAGTWSPTPRLGPRRDEWLAAGVFEAVAEEAMAGYDKSIGLGLSEAAVDGNKHELPGGGQWTGKNPTDRAKLGWRWSIPL